MDSTAPETMETRHCCFLCVGDSKNHISYHVLSYIVFDKYGDAGATNNQKASCLDTQTESKTSALSYLCLCTYIISLLYFTNDIKSKLAVNVSNMGYRKL